jgi:mannose-1-phosphate guanylyltransferase
VGPNASIGANSVVGKGCRIRDSILLDNVEVKPFTCVLYSILSSRVKIGSWCRIEGTPTYIDSVKNVASKSGPGIWDLWVVQTTTDLMLSNGMKNPSVNVIGDDVTTRDEVVIRNCIVLPHKELKASHTNEILM